MQTHIEVSPIEAFMDLIILLGGIVFVKVFKSKGLNYKRNEIRCCLVHNSSVQVASSVSINAIQASVASTDSLFPLAIHAPFSSLSIFSLSFIIIHSLFLQSHKSRLFSLSLSTLHLKLPIHTCSIADPNEGALFS
ncbi:hypothetical protein L2E82_48263 [Cichorium intybus]|uniref:Uncharacterized protein n=1 Tax=Cichorium intybus TaxID=13427 RepID=A0ACB8YY01_CICIN|nr:hypothetical protein L2E82_48263 [Cichorium intybus]